RAARGGGDGGGQLAEPAPRHERARRRLELEGVLQRGEQTRLLPDRLGERAKPAERDERVGRELKDMLRGGGEPRLDPDRLAPRLVPTVFRDRFGELLPLAGDERLLELGAGIAVSDRDRRPPRPRER